MNTTILEAYKALPYGKEFIAWLEEKHILDAFINRVEERCNIEGRLFDYYPRRCKKDKPADYITLSLWFCRCAEGEQFWRDIHNEWVLLCEERGYKEKLFTFDVYKLVKQSLSFSAYTQEQAEQLLKESIKNSETQAVAHELSSVSNI